MGDVFADPTNDQVFGCRLPLCPRVRQVSMGWVDPVLPATVQDRMGGNEPTLIQNAYLVRQLMYLDDAPGPIGDAVVQRSTPSRHG